MINENHSRIKTTEMLTYGIAHAPQPTGSLLRIVSVGGHQRCPHRATIILTADVTRCHTANRCTTSVKDRETDS